MADVVSIGGFAVEYHVEVDPQKAQALGVTLEDVAEALAKSNRNVGGGLMQRGEQSLIVRGIGLLHSPQEINEVVVAMRGGAPVTIGDVARVVQILKAVAELGATVCPVTIGSRKAFFRAQAAGQAVQEFEPQGPAADEIRRLYEYTTIRIYNEAEAA